MQKRGFVFELHQTLELDNSCWVDVLNLTPVKSANSSFVFKDMGRLDAAVVQEGGTIEILGFSNDRERPLVRYTAAPRTSPGGTAAPSGLLFLLDLDKVTKLEDQLIRLER